MPGIKITDEDRQRIYRKLICTCCDLLLTNPFQTMCGHLMCQSCIENLLKYDNCILLINIISLRLIGHQPPLYKTSCIDCAQLTISTRKMLLEFLNNN